ncbi:MAG: alkaline phosphatase [Marinifilaceae bacterium]|jgi:alkaline phosphatase|nr:alkaline phosphatase [Marinifilaceae bacterium]
MKHYFSKFTKFIFIFCCIYSFSSCTKEIEKKIEIEKDYVYKTPKYVFMFIGDGMAQVQINASRIAAKTFNYGELGIDRLPILGEATTNPGSFDHITDSAAAGTALATGNKTSNGTISMNEDGSENYKTIAELAKLKGMKIGIISSVSIDHATPACFYAHNISRSNYTAIASQMATSKFDYFAGGYSKSKNNIVDEMTSNGYRISSDRNTLNSLSKENKNWAYTGYDSSSALQYAIDKNTENISLKEFTEKGIELLDNDKGFFMMVEGGKIDWACHANDAKAAIYDVLAFDNALKSALNFYEKHPEETLIIVTGDHECGGMTIGFAATGYNIDFSLLKSQNLSFEEFNKTVKTWVENKNIDFNDALNIIKEKFGLGDSDINPKLALSEYEIEKLKEAFNKTIDKSLISDNDKIYKYGNYVPFTVTVTHILNNKAGLSFSSFAHTGVPVPVYAIGAGARLFDGSYDNTDIAKKIIKIAKLK